MIGALAHLKLVASTCSDLELSVTVSSHAEQISLPQLHIDDPNLADDLINTILGDVGNVWPLITVEGTFKISATFCEPEVYSESGTVQLLHHGATYNKLYWSEAGFPNSERYDWTRYATSRGYATLAIDRLGSGNSSRPDPLIETQANLEAEILHQVVLQLRQGQIGGRKYSSVACVGHSLGSMFLMRATQLHPTDCNAVILTGWGANIAEHLPKDLSPLLAPAAALLDRFADLNPLYLTYILQEGASRLFYGPKGSFDPQLQKYDFDHRDTVEVGEILTLFAGTTKTNYAGPVYVIVGEFDQILCPPNGCTTGAATAPGNTAQLFPNSPNFSYDIVPGTGHCLNLQYSANVTFSLVHQFLSDAIETF